MWLQSVRQALCASDLPLLAKANDSRPVENGFIDFIRNHVAKIATNHCNAKI
jgi:hypothetical protein